MAVGPIVSSHLVTLTTSAVSVTAFPTALRTLDTHHFGG